MSKIIMLLLILMSFSPINMQSQDSLSNWTIGTELYNRWNWRGIGYTTTPIMQPYLEYSYKNFTIGAWGSYSLVNSLGTEADLYLSYEMPFGLKIDLGDYYSPLEDSTNGEFFRFKSAHTLDFSLTQSLGKLDLLASCFVNSQQDLYFEAKYHFKDVSVFAGGGNKYYTIDGKFNLTNIGLELEKEIKITDQYGLPLLAKALINPDTQEFFIIFGFRLESN